MYVTQLNAASATHHSSKGNQVCLLNVELIGNTKVFHFAIAKIHCFSAAQVHDCGKQPEILNVYAYAVYG